LIIAPSEVGYLFVNLFMTLYEFNMLDEMEQAEAVRSGTHIGERKYEEFDILLHQIDSFYVEVFYYRQYNVIRRLRSFSSTK